MFPSTTPFIERLSGNLHFASKESYLAARALFIGDFGVKRLTFGANHSCAPVDHSVPRMTHPTRESIMGTMYGLHGILCRDGARMYQVGRHAYPA